MHYTGTHSILWRIRQYVSFAVISVVQKDIMYCYCVTCAIELFCK